MGFTPNTGLANYSTYTNSSFVAGGVVTLQLSVILSTPTTWGSSSLRLGTLGAAAVPSADVSRNRVLLVTRGSDGTEVSLRGIRIDTSGNLYMEQSGSTANVMLAVLLGVQYRIDS